MGGEACGNDISCKENAQGDWSDIKGKWEKWKIDNGILTMMGV